VVDVAVLGAGIAGLTAAYRLRGLDVEVFEAADWIGGRTKSRQFSGSSWANFGAQYVSDDKVKVVELCTEVGARLIPAPFDEAAEKVEMSDEVRQQLRRIEDEQAHPRDPTEWELDGQTFAEWLGPSSEEARQFWDHWASGMCCSSIIEMSLYGFLWFWGPQRTSPWSVVPVESSGLGPTVVEGGTNDLTLRLATQSGARISLRTPVESVVRSGDGYEVRARQRGARIVTYARRVVCALPAPAALAVCKDLPAWKRETLAQVRYGRFLATPILVSPANEPVGPWRFSPTRPGQRYNSNDFRLKSPGDFEKSGGCFHSYVYDRYARQIWDDPDESIMSGAVGALLATYPQYEERIRWVGIQRWETGLPHYTPGHMRRLEAIRAPVGGLSFCGDYCSPSNTEGAAHSGERAASEVSDQGRG
jgi:predicted NAD/FAD-dependent oxidoreductase